MTAPGPQLRAPDPTPPLRPPPALSAASLRSVLVQLSLAIFIFRGERLVYSNPPATRLVQRLRNKYRIELLVMLHDHVAEFRESVSDGPAGPASNRRDKRS